MIGSRVAKLMAIMVLTLSILFACPSVHALTTFTEVASGTADVQGIVGTSGLRIVGFSCRETAGSPDVAKFVLRHGTNTSGPAIAIVNLAAGESVREAYGTYGYAVPNGVFVDRISGTSFISIITEVVPNPSRVAL